MKREISDVTDPGGCCPGHDSYPADTYAGNQSKRARSKGIKKEHRHARRVKKHRLQNAPEDVEAPEDLEGRIRRYDTE